MGDEKEKWKSEQEIMYVIYFTPKYC